MVVAFVQMCRHNELLIDKIIEKLNIHFILDKIEEDSPKI